MSKKSIGNDRVNEAIDRLAGLFEYGHLLSCSNPAALLNKASDEIERLRGSVSREAPEIHGSHINAKPHAAAMAKLRAMTPEARKAT